MLVALLLPVTLCAAGGDLRLIQAVDKGDAKAVRMLLTQRVSVTEVTPTEAPRFSTR